MISRLEAKDLLRHIGTQPDEDIDLAEAALALAALDHPDVSLQRYRDHLSLLATQVISRMREALQVDVPLGDLFDRPTVAELSAHLTSAGSGSPRI